MALKVRTLWIVGPIILAVLLIGAAVFTLNYFEVEQSDTGYRYKEKLFNKDTVGTINISISDENWQKILDDPVAEQYVEASITINGETYDNVGVRAKGNSSLSSVATSDSERYSLKVDFAQYDSKQTYYGLDTVNLNNNFSDTTQMKEFVSYELMEQMGIATPAHAYVNVQVNGEDYGLLLAVEEVGEAFAKTNFGSTEGFIFKPEEAGSDLAYVSDDVKDYSGIFDGVKMNKKTAEKNSNIITMMKQISEGDTSSLNVDEIARYFALNTALVNLDSYQGSFKHNYYLYEDGEGQFSILPWDYNMAFGGFGGGGGPSFGGMNMDADKTDEQQVTPTQPNAEGNQQMPPQNEKDQNMPPEGAPAMQDNQKEQIENNIPADFDKNGGNRGGGLMLNENIVTDSSVNFSVTEPVSGTTVDARPLLKIILEDAEARSLYEQYLEKIATEILTEDNVLAITTKLHELLLQSVEDDPSKFSTTEQFVAGGSGEQSLPQFAKQRSESILKQLSGEIEGVSNASESGMPGGNMPQMNGEMPEGGMPPQMNGEMPARPNSAKGAALNTSTNSKNALLVLGGSLALLLLAIVLVVVASKRKYKRR